MIKIGLLLLTIVGAGVLLIPDRLQDTSVNEGVVLAQQIETAPTPTPIPTVIPTATASATPVATVVPTPKPTPKPTPTPKPVQQYSSEQIYSFTNTFGGQYGVDPNVIRHLAICESGFNPAAKYHIYGGLFQFAPATWKNYRVKLGLDPDPDLRYEAQEAVRTAAYVISVSGLQGWPNCQP